jgi:DNA (cytosine-5)-methyltransferase 1
MCQQDKTSGTEIKTNIIAVDLFCGAGGLTRGLLDAHINVKMGVDFDDRFRKTYESNNHPAIFDQADIKTLNGKDLERRLNVKPDDIFMLAACAPCQPFSRHNKNHYHDRRKSLLLQVGRILEEMHRKPDILFFENVPAITKIDNGRNLKTFCRILSNLGYNYSSDIVDAKNYGVPQTRKRFIMIGILRELYSGELIFPCKTHGKERLMYITVQNAIKHLPRLRAGQRHPQVFNHECAALKPINKQRLKKTPINGGSRTAWPEDLFLKCHINHSGHKDVYGRMEWKKPSPTLTCKCVSISNGRFGHPTQLRGISLKEAALLQSFPDNYEFYGKFRNMAMQIGNAVPPLLAEVFGKYLADLIQETKQGSVNCIRNASEERETNDSLEILP